MKAVIWTDFFQGLVLFIGLIAVIIMVSMSLQITQCVVNDSYL